MQLNNVILKVERPIFDLGFLNLSYENNLIRNSHIFQVGLRYIFDFAQTTLSSRIGNKNSSFVESARGSLMFNSNRGNIIPGNRTSLSKAALTIVPFLDYNRNGERDPMEPSVPGVELKSTAGYLSYNEDESVLQIIDLQPYVNVILEIDQGSLNNIAWKVKDPKIAVETVPINSR